MEIKIRQAEQADIQTLLAFEKGIIKTERPYDITLKEGDIHYYDLSELIKSAESTVVLAEVDTKIVGSGYAQIRKAEAYLKHSHFAYLGFMYVDPAFRGKGINQMILEGLSNWAAEKNITELRLDVYDENIIAKNAYLKAGFKPLLLQMRKGL